MIDFTAIIQLIVQIALLVVAVVLSIPILLLIYKGIVHYIHVFRVKRNSMRLKYLEIQVPQDNETQIADAEQMFAGLSGMEGIESIGDKLFGGDSFISFEIIAQYEEIKFLVVCPENLSDIVARHINGVYSDAEINEVEPFDIYQEEDQKFVAGRIALTNKNVFIPIKSYEKLSADPLSSLLENLSSIQKGDAVTIQIVIHEINEGWRVAGKRFIDTKSQSELNEDGTKKDYSIGEETLSGITEKISKTGFGTEIKVISRSKDKQIANQNLQKAISTLSQMSNPGQNSLRYKRARGRIIKTEYQKRFPRNSMILNTAELATLYHFPNSQIHAPHIQWVQSVKGEASNLIPNTFDEDYMWLGQAVFRNNKQDVFIKPSDRLRHMYVVGQTGTGKSKFIAGACLRDIKMGHGTAFIDPHGSDTEWIIERIPEERKEDVIIFDPSDLDNPIGMNMLEYEKPEQRTLIINDMLTIFDKLYNLKMTGGPIFEQYMRNAMMLVMSHPESGNTILEIPRVLTDEKFRELKLKNTDLQDVVRFWREEATKVEGEASLKNLVPYITSKLSTFLYNDFVRPIVIQQNSTINFRDVLDNKKILLIKLSKGLIGDVNSNFLGMIIIGKLLLAALSREDIPEEQREPFYLYIDEFQNFLTDSIYSILSEARKYKLSLTIAHQFINQLVTSGDTKIRDSVFGNVGTRVYMRVGSDDSSYLERDLEPYYTATDLQNQSNGWAYVKLLVDGTFPPPFTMYTWFGNSEYDMIGDPNPPELTKKIKEFAAKKYGRPREQVEKEIEERESSAKLSNMSKSDQNLLGAFNIDVNNGIVNK